jgi:DNA adenine methylase Dam
VNPTEQQTEVAIDQRYAPPVPIVRWVGGKSWIAPLIADVLLDVKRPITTYVEPFAGSLAVLCELASRGALDACNILIADACRDLANLYREIRLDDLSEFESCVLPSTGAEYYALRSRFNTNLNELRSADPPATDEARTELARRTRDHAVMFWALNRTCFNGLTRYGPNGFNVPYGTIAQPKKPDVRGLARALAPARIYSDWFYALTAVADLNSGYVNPYALVYLDPPYLAGVDDTKASKKGSAYTAYSGDTFTYQDQQELAEYACALVQGGARVVVSNADTPKIDKLYPSSLFEIVARPQRRNAVRPDLGKTSGEVLLLGKNPKGERVQ